MLIQVISAFFATVAFALLFYLPRKYLVLTGLTGSFGWLIYLLCIRFWNDKVTASFVATLFIALSSHILARIFKTPVTMFLIPGIIPLVPGAGMYQLVHSIVDNTSSKTSGYFYQTLQIAGAIALGIFIIDTIFRRSIRLKPRKNEK
jgi:uncharacterized membrane protein YjjB (DUF3815 family)